MGNCLGKGKGRRSGPPPPLSPLEQKLVDAINSRRGAEGSNPIKHFNTLLMKFGKIGKGFESLRAVFKELDADGSGSISKEDLVKGYESAGLPPWRSSEEQEEILEAADFDGNNTIEFREFVVIVALNHVLGMGAGEVGAGEGEGSAVEGSGAGISPELTAAIDLSVNTFLFLDDSGNGTLERNEVLQSLDESRGQGKGQAGNAAIMKRRFEEMDWDNNGNISYLEFLFALESWVGIEDQEDSEGDS